MKFEIETGRQHDHLICAECGRIPEFHNPELLAMQAEIARLHDFDLHRHTLTLYGYCNDQRCNCAQ